MPDHDGKGQGQDREAAPKQVPIVPPLDPGPIEVGPVLKVLKERRVRVIDPGDPADEVG